MAESAGKKKDRVIHIIDILSGEYPHSRCSLHFTNPLELLVATILSAQCTDERVNIVTPPLFVKYPSARHYVDTPPEELAEDIRSTGFFNNKARSIQRCCSVLLEQFGGAVPGSMENLVSLPGVGRKTANVILGNAFGVPGITVDTHVKRLSARLGLSDKNNPDKIETDLNELVPRGEWTHFSHLLIDHGRKICRSRTPLCEPCAINHLCPSNGMQDTG